MTTSCSTDEAWQRLYGTRTRNVLTLRPLILFILLFLPTPRSSKMQISLFTSSRLQSTPIRQIPCTSRMRNLSKSFLVNPPNRWAYEVRFKMRFTDGKALLKKLRMIASFFGRCTRHPRMDGKSKRIVRWL